ncbi:RNA polymerase sigma factor [Rhizobium leguminosarum bv. trifolii CB782]|uniref:RNA polymerase sigma factor n=1 Tax=Rhizobium hidalgonense TaxID=1538159 RepID=A0A2A6KD03_9HYPH|nr:sigma-70 family RNA polymerase sigma factor [Rhizobium hidalgonense]AHG45202.1 RNA polymerase sigma factor [Rhizobium leguminosarum bv. trifolii CB782]EJC72848.1 RNA polymerase sigma factor, sigma-70 family [Rhizobium leguminosarum bv. trifolii WSM2012]MDR9774516.1 sigma-70 family RNA polymerase sigma factor [Rhizobium hidalgonense]MDR9809496.1 sigma-70 family RNA polymerase sigma factor [Rhizobium hidalgonense]MDR9821006.1 sigma-70 family RNA polymerase sigma factor [Rhizobium hidalgonense
MQDHDRPGFTDAELLDNMPALRCFARRFHSSTSDIDDLVQETIAKAIAHSGNFRPGTRLRSWLFTIMRNTFCTKFKMSKREYVGEIEDSADWASSPPSQIWEVRGHELEVAISALPDNYRTAVDLVFLQGVSYEAAADRCGVPIGTIKSRVNRARHQLTKALDTE